MPNVTGIRFRQVGKVYHFATGEFIDLKSGDWVIVETARGTEAGWVVIPPQEIPREQLTQPLKSILRRATAWDMTQMECYRLQEAQMLRQCREKVADFNLPMKVIKAECNFDGSHITFYFTSEKRVDFRQLVRELASAFKARIELRQVGVRDEVKLIGGLGCCGRVACCITHLTEFSPISIKMAKQQNLPLSPMEISGTCGRLLCCLSYENDHYVEAHAELPKTGDRVQTPYGSGKIREVNVIKQTLTVELENGAVVEVPTAEMTQPRKNFAPKARRRPK
jgi:cell fate regulator YaaT (PSP1 superfamily)